MRLKITLNDACNIAKARGGSCLSDKFINNKIPLRWKCSKDHEWNAPLDKIKNRNTWCPVCAATKELLQWRCSKGYEWSATYNTG
ncbi:hypothetical protein Glove_674g12 [Diversispora epigaea]|uniref:Zinc-ribbon domain-containing protein n=1 Tax=Diversispora epigaea TaxID=1348612 RepID=A0A397G358_9GLOM|nr:hypothetical protein Glove_674g12 [Diversispora epigaea]